MVFDLLLDIRVSEQIKTLAEDILKLHERIAALEAHPLGTRCPRCGAALCTVPEEMAYACRCGYSFPLAPDYPMTPNTEEDKKA